MAVKKQLLGEKVAPHLRADAILSTNTSGLSVNEIASALPEALRPRFLVTHFFNPPRYMRLVEIVSSRFTDPAVAARMAELIRAARGDLKRANQSLIDAANGAGGVDNITSVLVQVHA